MTFAQFQEEPNVAPFTGLFRASGNRPGVDVGLSMTIHRFQSRSRGFSLFGLSLARRYSLQPFMDGSFSMMVPLIANVLDNPLEVSCPKTNYTITRLPFQNLLPSTDHLVYLMR